MTLEITDKLALVVFAWACAFLLSWQYSLAFVIVFILLVGGVHPFRPVSESGWKYFKRFLIYAFPLVLVLVTVNGILMRDGEQVHLGFVTIYEGGLQYGLTVSTRIVLLSISILVFFVSVHVRDLVKYFQTRGLPHQLASIFLLTLFFLEQLPHRISNVYTAQEARGAPVRRGFMSRSKAFFVVLSPLVLSSIVESVERGVALELRGYYRYPGTKLARDGSETQSAWRYLFLLLTLFVIILTIVRWLSKP